MVVAAVTVTGEEAAAIGEVAVIGQEEAIIGEAATTGEEAAIGVVETSVIIRATTAMVGPITITETTIGRTSMDSLGIRTATAAISTVTMVTQIIITATRVTTTAIRATTT